MERLVRYATGTCPAAVSVSCKNRNWAEPYEAITIRKPVLTRLMITMRATKPYAPAV
jgi:hypothetical protein